MKKKNKKCYLSFASSSPFSIVIQLMFLPNPIKKKNSHPYKWRLRHMQRMSDKLYCRIVRSSCKFQVDDIPLSKADGSGISFFIDLTTESKLKCNAIY